MSGDFAKSGSLFQDFPNRDNEYSGITISLEKISFGEHHRDNLQYQVATFDEYGSERGQNPRLEFPECTKDIFENWYAETTDNRGSRLELRFAQPNLMDLNVWNKLSANDQLLITSIIRALPDQIFSLQKESSDIDIEWPTLYKVAFDLKRILSNVILKQKSHIFSTINEPDQKESIKG